MVIYILYIIYLVAIYASGLMSAQAYDLMGCPARSRASRPVAMPPQISTREIALSGRGHVGSWTREGSLGQQSVVSPSGGGSGMRGGVLRGMGRRFPIHCVGGEG